MFMIFMIYMIYKLSLSSFKSSGKIIYSTNFKPSGRIACLYCYFEKNKRYKDNFEYFLNNGILKEVDYYIVINGDISLNLDKFKYYNNIIFYKKENKGYDFGGWSFLMSNITKEYDYYFFINTSVIGPYGDKYGDKWIDKFLPLFNHGVKVVGTSINIYMNKYISNFNLENIYKRKAPFCHVQSMFFGIDNEYKNYLMNKGFFDEEKYNSIKDINEVICYGEIGLSQLALNNGWNINCILKNYKDVDYTKIYKDFNWSSNNGDPYFKNAYFGRSIFPDEVVFFKSYRLE